MKIEDEENRKRKTNKTVRTMMRLKWTFWDILGHFRTFWDILGHSGTFWDILGHFGTFWDIIGHFGTLWDNLRRV